MNNKKKNKDKSKFQCNDNKLLQVSVISESLFYDKIKPIVELVVIIGGFIIGYIELQNITTQTAMQTQQIKEQYLWDKKNATFQYLDKYTEKLRNTTDNLKLLLETDSIETVFKNKEKKVEIMDLVGYFENLAIGIENDYFDENIAISSLYRQVLIAYNELTKHRYFTVREEEVGRPTAKNFRKLAEKWKQM